MSEPILRALAFFDLFDRPLRLEELRTFAWREVPERLEETVVHLEADGMVKQGDGWISLSPFEGSDDRHADSRIAHMAERDVAAAPLVARAEAFAAMCLRLPYVRGVFLVNSLAMRTNGPGSDIDVLVIGRQGRLWLVRALVSVATHLRGWRRHGDKVAGRVCLSFFLADDALDLSDARLPAGDPYLAYWLATVLHLGGSVDRAALLEANPWVYADLPGLPRPDGEGESQARPTGWERLLTVLGLGWLGNAIAKTAFLLWRRRRGAMDPSTNEVANDRIQKFHARDRRSEFRSEWRALCAALGVD